MRTDFILDFETIGQQARKVPALDCSFMTFEWDRFLSNPYTFKELVGNAQTLKLSIKDQVKNYDFEYKESDLQWWMDQDPKVRRKIKPMEDDVTVAAFAEKFVGYLRQSEKISYWWSRSNTFDPVILEHLTTSVNKDALVNQYIPFWKVRDTRTFIDSKFNFTTQNGFVPVANEALWNQTFNAHDSTHDIAADVLRLQAIHRAENDMEQIEI